MNKLLRLISLLLLISTDVKPGHGRSDDIEEYEPHSDGSEVTRIHHYLSSLVLEYARQISSNRAVEDLTLSEIGITLPATGLRENATSPHSRDVNWLGSSEGKRFILQMNLQIMARLYSSKHGHGLNISVGELALHLQAVTFTCQHPEQFYGVNLLQHLSTALRHGVANNRFRSSQEVAMAILSLTGDDRKEYSHLIHRSVQFLLDPQRRDQDFYYRYGIDETSWVLIALSNVHVKGDMRRRVIVAKKKLVRKLLQHQWEDGSFQDDPVSTALALQALLAADKLVKVNVDKIMQYFTEYLDSLSGSPPVTTSLRILRTLASLMSARSGKESLRNRDCLSHANAGLDSLTRDLGADESLDVIEVTIKVYNSINNLAVYGDRPVLEDVVSAPEGTTLLKVLERAQVSGNSALRFSSVITQWGRMITGVNNLKQYPPESLYWTVLFGEFSTPPQPLPISIDKFTCDQSGVVELWYSKF